MLNARDTLFINRMAELVTSYELIEFRNKGFYIRNKSRKIDNNTVLTYAFCLMKAGLLMVLLNFSKLVLFDFEENLKLHK